MITFYSLPPEECLKNIAENHEAEIEKDDVKIEKVFKEVSFVKNVDSNSEEASQKAEICVKSEQGVQSEKKSRNEHSQKTTVLKKEEQSIDTDEEILEFKTPEDDKGGSYLIKYNLSTTPYLER